MVKAVLIIYNLLLPIAFLLYLPIFLTKLIRRGNFKRGFWERFGIYSKTKKSLLYQCPRPIWIHAVSVGETVAALSFIREWSKQQPELTFVLSTTTSTGQHIARTRAPENVISIYFPIDFYGCVWLALNTIRPCSLIIFEVEIWPSLIVEACRRDISIALVNTRMSDQSAKGYQSHRWLFKHIFKKFSLICTQTEDDAAKIKSIIGDNSTIEICNTMKFDQLPDHSDGDEDRSVDSLFPQGNRIVFTAASTHPGEEVLMMKVYKILLQDYPDLYHVLIPRHVERSLEIEKRLKFTGLNYVRLTELRKALDKQGNPLSRLDQDGDVRVLLVDTTGEMMHFLAQSDIVFVGNSLAGNRGGHNLIEPALFRKPIVIGSGMDNFRVVAQIFKDNNACVQVDSEKALLKVLRNLINNKGEREQLGQASYETIQKNRGAINKTIGHLRLKCLN